jgi:(S)-mandelate dehydrogenase
MRASRAINIADLRDLARRRLPRVVFDYLDGGAEDETTIAWNREAFARWALVPRILPGAPGVDLTAELFGDRLALPLIVGPTGLNGIFWPRADVLLARAAGAAGAVFTLSTASNSSMEDVAAAGPGVRWFQLYAWGEQKVWGRLLERAAAAGYRALVITVDTLAMGKRERDLRNDFAHQVRYTTKVVLDGLRHPRWLAGTWLRGGVPRFENWVEFAPEDADARQLTDYVRANRNPALSWDDLAWLRDHWRGPFLIKGVLAAEDAERAVAMGADGVVVSNHGGRQLDAARSSISVLPRIAEVVGDKTTVLMDGGIRSGQDVTRALALGAKACMIGRAWVYGVAARGEAGVTGVLETMKRELRTSMALIGKTRVSDIDASVVQT